MKRSYKLGSVLGSITEVIGMPRKSGLSNFCLVLSAENLENNQMLEDGRFPAAFVIDDDGLIRLIEEAHKLLFDDFIDSGKISKKITISFENAEAEEGHLQGENYLFIRGFSSVNPKAQAADHPTLYEKINPIPPKPDFFHRYIEVPLSYKNPEKGSFRLYYEINSDFKEDKPIIMIPTDAQREGSQTGMADVYKNRIMETSFNTVTYEYRNLACSKIAKFWRNPVDWVDAYEVFHSDNAVEDIEMIRRDLLGPDGQFYLWGGSGIAIMALQYLAKYHRFVKRAFLMSFFKDAWGSCAVAVDYWNNFLLKEKLLNEFGAIRRDGRVPLDQFYFLAQRLLYEKREKAVDLIKRTAAGDLAFFNEETEKYGTVDYFTRWSRKYFPQLVVYMYETNVPTSKNGESDVNYPFYQIAEPLNSLEQKGAIKGKKLDVQGLEKVSTEVLLVGGTLDHVTPVSETEKIHKLLPNSKLAVFEAYHGLQGIPETRIFRNRLSEFFFENGFDKEKIREFLENEGPKGKFLKLLEK